jgi:hypothetical protein
VQIELLRRSVEASFVYILSCFFFFGGGGGGGVGFFWQANWDGQRKWVFLGGGGPPPPPGRVCFWHPIWNGKRNSVIVLGILSFLSGPGIFSCRKVFLSCHRDLSGGFAVQLFCIIVLSTSM